MDDQNPFGRMEMLNTGRACGMTVSADRRPIERAGSIVQPPSHGIAGVRRLRDGTVATYVPEPGFTGQDSFKVRFGTGSQTMTIDVTVIPARG